MGLRNRDNQEIWEIRVKSTSWWRYLVSLSFVGLGLFTGYVYLTGELPSFAKIKKAVKERATISTPTTVAKAPKRTETKKPTKPERRAWQLDTVVSQVKQNSEAMALDKAAEISQMLQHLRQQGAAAIPAIRAFLRTKGDIDFFELGGTQLIAYRTLRLALFDMLNQIGGSEALALSVEQIRDTQDPAEIALLARNLEKQAPGVYRDEVVRIANEVLQQEEQLAPEEQSDVSPLFSMLQSYGGKDVVNKLEHTTPRWWEYSLIALAGLPKGEGLPILLARASDLAVPVQYKPSLPFQMLAQVAVQYPEAGETLVELTRLGQIPDRAWQGVGEALEGKHLQFSSRLFDDPAPTKGNGKGTSGQLPLAREYTHERTNTRYEQRIASTAWSTEQVQQQISLIDELLKATEKNPEAVKSLQQARLSLEKGPR